MPSRLFLTTALAFLVSLAVLPGCSSPRQAYSSGSNAMSSTLDIVNRTGTPIYYLYLSPCSSNTWGSDQLGSDVIMSGTTYAFAMTPGCWDLKAQLRDGREVERRNVNMRTGDRKSWTLS